MPALWQHSRHLITAVHEAGHAAAALLSGRRVRAITLHPDGSGWTDSLGRNRGFGLFATALAGYLAAPVFGLCIAAFTAYGYGAQAWWMVCGLAVLLLIFIRNWYGGLLVVALAGAMWAMQAYVHDEIKELGAVSFSWFLLLGGWLTTVELWIHRGHRRANISDADVLARLTHIPSAAWNLGFIAGATLAIWGAWALAV